MQKIIIDKKYANKKIDRVIKLLFPKLSQNFLYKAFRKKDIKVNGIRVDSSYILSSGDILEIYIVDDILENTNQTLDYSNFFDVVYQDENLLIVNKVQGLCVHNDKTNDKYNLLDLVTKYLSNPNITPMLCHRLDRNTGGLILISKNTKTLDLLLEKIKLNEIQKYYKCLVYGKPPKKSGLLTGYLFKDKKLSKVFIKDTYQKKSAKNLTKYKLISYENNVSTLEIELLTGKTHQIRAHLAHNNLPIIGDGKYGSNKINKNFSYKFQALWAYKLKFDFKEECHLSYLNNKVFCVTPTFL